MNASESNRGPCLRPPTTAEIRAALVTAISYMEHPEVRAIAFATPSATAAQSLHRMVEALDR